MLKNVKQPDFHHYQQQPFFFSTPLVGYTGFDKTIVYCTFVVSYLFVEATSFLLLAVGQFTSGKRAAISLKNYWILAPVLALTSLKSTIFLSAVYLPSAQVTSLSSKSTLLAKSAMITPSPLWFFTSSIHFCTLLKVFLLVISQTITATEVSLMQLGIKALKRY